MSVYRESETRCPTCSNPLRDYERRLICDHCNAMLITIDDFAKAVGELDGTSPQAVTSDEHACDVPCPRCGGPATLCRLAIGPTAMPNRYIRCPAHGVWMPQQDMAAVFARVSRRAHFGAGYNRSYGGVGGNQVQPGTTGGLAGAMSSISDAFGSGAPATSALGIHSGRGISHVHTVFVSSYKNRALTCPVCAQTPLAYEGDRWSCPSCGGAFVETAALIGMVEDITGRPYELHTASTALAKHGCPLCGEPMVIDHLEGRPVARCTPHGVWFDAHVLAAVLEHAGAPDAHAHTSWLGRLFHRQK
ncbi:MAG TPA: hypothetical protein VMJ10_08035 [Kofleriaceae bacterium]|nr:hypothetical protein [Kofleriaceae bacterium]